MDISNHLYKSRQTDLLLSLSNRIESYTEISDLIKINIILYTLMSLIKSKNIQKSEKFLKLKLKYFITKHNSNINFNIYKIIKFLNKENSLFYIVNIINLINNEGILNEKTLKVIFDNIHDVDIILKIIKIENEYMNENNINKQSNNILCEENLKSIFMISNNTNKEKINKILNTL